MATKSAALVACLLCLAAAAAWAQDDELVVRTPLGVVRGVYADGEQARAFFGLPYAQPPVGSLRWQWPAPVRPWGDLNATQPSPGCPQDCHDPAYTCPQVTSEDCLYLNVFAPRLRPGGPGANPPAPVFVFAHGGNFRTGQGAAPLYSGRYLANATGTVVVTINYRLGALGWLLSPGPGGLPGNQGLHDVAAALGWVQQNIASFGGDPSRVTLAGQSAGAVITGVMMYSELGRGLFSRAMQISNLMGLPLRSVSEAYGLQAFVAGKLGCAPNDTACLLAANTSAVLAASEAALADVQLDSAHFLEAFLCYGPVAGTPEVPVQPYLAAIGGLVRPVPLVLGDTASEGTLFVGMGFPGPVPAAAYDVVLGVVSGSINGALTLAAEYPCTNASDARGAMTLAADDVVFLCPHQNATLAMGLRAPAYRYSFDRVSSFNQW